MTGGGAFGKRKDGSAWGAAGTLTGCTSRPPNCRYSNTDTPQAKKIHHENTPIKRERRFNGVNEMEIARNKAVKVFASPGFIVFVTVVSFDKITFKTLTLGDQNWHLRR
jgi:hypothetical protein